MVWLGEGRGSIAKWIMRWVFIDLRELTPHNPVEKVIHAS
jgi:hypothetical protein